MEELGQSHKITFRAICLQLSVLVSLSVSLLFNLLVCWCVCLSPVWCTLSRCCIMMTRHTLGSVLPQFQFQILFSNFGILITSNYSKFNTESGSQSVYSRRETQQVTQRVKSSSFSGLWRGPCCHELHTSCVPPTPTCLSSLSDVCCFSFSLRLQPT